MLTERASVCALRLLTIDRNHFDVSELADCRGMEECTVLTCNPEQNICIANCAKLHPSSQPNSCRDIQQISRLYWTWRIHYLILSQMNSDPTFTSDLLCSYFNLDIVSCKMC